MAKAVRSKASASKVKTGARTKAKAKPVPAAKAKAAKAKVSAKAKPSPKASLSSKAKLSSSKAKPAPKTKASKAQSFSRTRQAPKVASGRPALRRRPAVSARSGVRASASHPLADYVDASIGALALRVDPRWNAMIATHLQVILQQAAMVSAFALPDDAEPAPIFKA